MQTMLMVINLLKQDDIDLVSPIVAQPEDDSGTMDEAGTKNVVSKSQDQKIEADDKFGIIRGDENGSEFDVEFGGHSTTVDIDAGEKTGEVHKRVVVHLKRLCSEEEKRDKRLKLYASSLYLSDLNDEGWLDENGSEYTEGSFIAKMRPEGITMKRNGSFKDYYDDGEMFGSHVIIVEGTLEDGPNHECLAG